MKTILITGGTRGIGRAITRKLACGDHRLAISYRGDRRAAEDTAEELTETGISFELFQCDLSDRSQARTLPARVIECFGSLDGLVNNAAMADDGAFLTMSADRYRKVIETNLLGTITLTGSALPYLVKGKDPAVVILASLAGVAGREGQVPYAATKGGLIGFTQMLGRRFGPSGVRVNAVAPGLVRTDMVDALGPDTRDNLAAGTALRRLGTPEEVANAVAFLLSPGYVNASTLHVDGGFRR